MPDITMCDNDKCILKDKCYRYTAIPSTISQSYATFKPTGYRCSAFLPIRK